MSDVVERVRAVAPYMPKAMQAETVLEAADEIERLRELLGEARNILHTATYFTSRKLVTRIDAALKGNQ